MNKSVMKNREAFIRHLYSLKLELGKESSYQYQDDDFCLCAKGRAVALFMPEIAEPNEDGGYSYMWVDDSEYSWNSPPGRVSEALGMDMEEWNELEEKYEGARNSGVKRNPYHVAAEYLESLPGWPKVLGGEK